MKKVTGDLIKLAQQGEFDVIVHGCNCFNTMGSGVARAIRCNFSHAAEADRITKRGDKEKLGTITFSTEYDYSVTPSTSLTIVNAYTQYNYGRTKRHVDYDAVRSCFRQVKLTFSGLRIGFPAIGAGLGGGDWSVIKKIICEELEGEDYTLIVLP